MRLEDGEIEDGKMIIDQLLFNKKNKGGGLNLTIYKARRYIYIYLSPFY